MEVVLIIGAYVAVIGAYALVFQAYRHLSNHMSGKIDKIGKELSDFKSSTNRSLGRIEGAINKRGGGSGGERSSE